VRLDVCVYVLFWIGKKQRESKNETGKGSKNKARVKDFFRMQEVCISLSLFSLSLSFSSLSFSFSPSFPVSLSRTLIPSHSLSTQTPEIKAPEPGRIVIPPGPRLGVSVMEVSGLSKVLGDHLSHPLFLFLSLVLSFHLILSQPQTPEVKAPEPGRIVIPPGPRLGVSVMEVSGLSKVLGDQVCIYLACVCVCVCV